MLSVIGEIIINAADWFFNWRARKSLTKKILTGKVNIVYIYFTNEFLMRGFLKSVVKHFPRSSQRASSTKKE